MGTDEKETLVTVKELITICRLQYLDWNEKKTHYLVDKRQD